jgi:hypothetical protein
MRAISIAFVLLAMTSIACEQAGPDASSTPLARAERLTSRPTGSQLMFISAAADDSFRYLSFAPLDAPGRAMFVTPLRCERAYFAGTRGICLTDGTDGAKTLHYADIFDERFERTHRLTLTGPPSRVRVSPDGRRAAATVFESGHSYAQEGFSTRTTIIDLQTGHTIGDLEQFAVFQDATRLTSVDFNFWGVTFERDGNGFYATLDTRGVQYLVRGDINKRAVRIVRPDVECPSLSPDNTQLVFKRLIGARSRGWWQLTRLDLKTNRETVLARETRSVDDQVEWLDDHAVMYHLTGAGNAADLWVLALDGKSPPRLMLASAYSPAVLREQ